MIYIASMNMRGEWAKCPDDCIKMNVTSMQSKSSQLRKDLSPMSPETAYKEFYCFENFWQSGKRFSHLNHNDVSEHRKYVQKWKDLTKGKRRILPGTYKPFDALFETERDTPFGYLESRKQIYIPLYSQIIKEKPSIKKYRELLKEGKNICIYDFDGPRDEDGKPICVEFNKETYEKYLNDTRRPFGHGFVVGKVLMDF